MVALLPVKKCVTNPVLCTVLSVLNTRRSVLLSEVMEVGSWEPQ